MIREFLFKVLIQMYNKNFFKLKPNKILDKLNINIDILSIKNNRNEKIFINQYKIFALNKTTALLQNVWSAIL